MKIVKAMLLSVLFFMAGYSPIIAGNPVNPGNTVQDELRAVRSLDQYLGSLSTSADPAMALRRTRLEQLVSGTLSGLFIRDGKLLNSSNKVDYIDSDVASLPALDGLISTAQNPEMLLVRIERPEELSTNHNISQNILARVKIIYFLCTFKPCEAPGCESALLIRMVPGNADPAPILLYRVSVAN